MPSWASTLYMLYGNGAIIEKHCIPMFPMRVIDKEQNMQQRGISYDWIRQCRQKLGLTQQQVADRARISRTYLSNLERGESTRPTVDVITRLSKALDPNYSSQEDGGEEVELYAGTDADGYVKVFTLKHGHPMLVSHEQWLDVVHGIEGYTPGELLRVQLHKEGWRSGIVELDSGYQIVCSVKGLKFRELVDWMAEQVGYEFENGDTVTAFESFQVIREGPYHDCIAICRVEKGEQA